MPSDLDESAPLARCTQPQRPMTMDPKSRMVSFRVSAEEYERMRELCFSQGLGSVSDFARTAIHALLQNPKVAGPLSLELRVADLEGRIKILTSDLRKLQGRAFPHIEDPV